MIITITVTATSRTLSHDRKLSVITNGADPDYVALHQDDTTHNIIYKRKIMLYTIAVVLLILWLLGLVTSTTIGGFIHILLVIAIVMVLLRLISGRKL